MHLVRTSVSKSFIRTGPPAFRSLNDIKKEGYSDKKALQNVLDSHEAPAHTSRDGHGPILNCVGIGTSLDGFNSAESD